MTSDPSGRLEKIGLPSSQLNYWQEIPRLSVIVMELTWIVPWFQFITLAVKDSSPVMLGLVLGTVTFLAYLLARIIFKLSIKAKIQRGVFLGFILLAIFLSVWIIIPSKQQPTDLWLLYNQSLDNLNDIRELIPPEIIIVIGVLLLSRRGFMLARDWGGANSVLNSIQISFILFVIYGMFVRRNNYDVIAVNLFVFLITAIFGMVTARIGSIKLQRGGRGVQFNLKWLGSILTTTVLLTGIAVIVASVSSGQLDELNQLLRLIFYTAFLSIATPFFALISRIFPALEVLQQALQTPEPEQVVPEWELENSKPPQGEIFDEMASSGVEFLLQLRLIVFMLLTVAMIIIIIRIARRLSDQNMTSTDDERESLLDGRNLFTLLWDALRGRVKQTADLLVSDNRLKQRAKIKAAMRIRFIYMEFLQLCEALGHARPSSQTPHEFLPTATMLLPQVFNELDIITNSYQRVRYGELPETHQEVEAVERAWKQVTDVGKMLKKQMNGS